MYKNEKPGPAVTREPGQDVAVTSPQSGTEPRVPQIAFRRLKPRVNQPRNPKPHKAPYAPRTLPALKTRGRWPSCAENDEIGALIKLDLSPHRLPWEEQFLCAPVCASCGEPSTAAATGRFIYRGLNPRLRDEEVFYDLCLPCVLIARGGGPAAASMRKHIHTLCVWTAANRRANRVSSVARNEFKS